MYLCMYLCVYIYIYIYVHMFILMNHRVAMYTLMLSIGKHLQHADLLIRIIISDFHTQSLH